MARFHTAASEKGLTYVLSLLIALTAASNCTSRDNMIMVHYFITILPHLT